MVVVVMGMMGMGLSPPPHPNPRVSLYLNHHSQVQLLISLPPTTMPSALPCPGPALSPSFHLHCQMSPLSSSAFCTQQQLSPLVNSGTGLA
ncbi:hypothetical protein Pmani_030561 [Petrolisthes manimaculis]|uniref:Uncharacterized protein n=1 Tax=Petrolisthes manimaculis TaxID=1843537 RepID=A0AAE1NWE2_9EUCA|nr:hypothetical protein Pmani_030561 [Petrolisthes manimaculis]